MRLRILALTMVALMSAGCVTSEYNVPSNMRVERENSANNPYQMTVSSDVARAGETSQRFEIRHGDCGPYDCNNDRRRIEAIQNDGPSEARPNQSRWYGWSIYLPQDFQDLTPTNTHLGQVKIVNWRHPIWAFTVRNGSLIFEHRTNGQDNVQTCRIASLNQVRGRWTDLVVFSDFSYDSGDDSPTLQVWRNGQLVCSETRTIVTKEMAAASRSSSIYMRIGIYNSYVSRWLNANKTRSVDAVSFNDVHGQTGTSIRSAAQRPFDYDWGVQLPTQVAFYDEVRIGYSREAVDVRMIYDNN